MVGSSNKVAGAATTERFVAASVGAFAAVEQPRLIFFTQLHGAALGALLSTPGILDHLSDGGHGLAVALDRLDEPLVQAIRLLNARSISLVAWLLLPPEEGAALNSQNYPRAIARYHVFRDWAKQYDLRFEAVGLDIEPLDEVGRGDLWSLRELMRRLRLAGANALYLPALAAYTELVAAIHYDGYEVHTYQVPVIADDRRAGTTLLQRALDIVEVPSDLEVLMCSSSISTDRLDGDLGGALIASYGPSADALGVGSLSEADDDAVASLLPWSALRRDLLLSAQYADTIYVFHLEDCVRRGFLEQIAALDWSASARAVYGKRTLVRFLRGAILVLLVAGRFGPSTLAWAGWVVAGVLWLRGRRSARRLRKINERP